MNKAQNESSKLRRYLIKEFGEVPRKIKKPLKKLEEAAIKEGMRDD
jgi:hypothetical protein